MSFEQLIREHGEIDRLCDQLLSICRSGKPAHQRADGILMVLADEVQDHLQHEDRAVYGPLIERYRGSPDVTTQGFEAQSQLLEEDWQSYLLRWSDGSGARWDKFCGDTEEMIERLQDRVRLETDLIYPLAFTG